MELTPQQIATLKAAIIADPNLAAARAIHSGVGTQMITDYLNSASTKVVFKTSAALAEVGKNFEATALSAMTSANNDRLVSFALWNPQGVDPTRADHRQFFNDVFSPASGAGTRAKLYALWRRFANRAEGLLAAGTGSDADPAALVFEGAVDEMTIRRLAFSDNGDWLL